MSLVNLMVSNVMPKEGRLCCGRWPSIPGPPRGGKLWHCRFSLRCGASTMAAKADPMNRFQPLESLTQRETEILVFLANGVSNKEIAKRLFVSENTVKFHLKNVYSKLVVGSRLQAINAARRMGLV